jgi:hypothetical protein
MELPKEPQRWKEGQWIYYFNHKDNGIQGEGKEGSRYEADFTITKSLNQPDIEKALIRSMADTDIEKCIVDNIEVEGMKAIEIKKEYKVDPKISNQIFH